MRCAWLVPLLLLAAGAAAQPQDALQTPACRRALDALQAHEAQLPVQGSASSPATRDALARHAGLRRQAARACLGGSGTEPPPQRLRAPVVVPPAGVPLPPAAPAVPPARPPALPVPPPGGPLVITRCEAAGCWASDGAYMPRAGAHLFGPRGLCSVQGATVHCP